jgi:carbonic anhydrase
MLFTLFPTLALAVSLRKRSEPGLWNYENGGKFGPENWSRVDHKYSACSAGIIQSPINIDTKKLGFVTDEASPLKFVWNAIPNAELDVEPFSIGSKFNDTTNGVEFRNKFYKTANFHFHRDAEHTIDSEKHELELHIVHASADGQFLVPSFIFKIGETTNGFVKQLLEPLKSATKVVSDLDFAPLIAGATSGMSSWSYVGSLTVPPCTEQVTFVISKKILEVCQADMDYLKTVFQISNRPIQRDSGDESANLNLYAGENVTETKQDTSASEDGLGKTEEAASGYGASEETLGTVLANGAHGIKTTFGFALVLCAAAY